MVKFGFKRLYKDSHSHARVGEIRTAHGVIKTPAFVPVGTQATVKSLTPEELTDIGVQLYFVNTYHMYLRPGIDVVKKAGGLHKFMNWDKPLMTDSGGFQIFSLKPKITDDGAEFQSHWDGSRHMFTPEKSMQWQAGLGSDIHIAFDDCTPYGVTHEKAKKSLARTHEWAKRSLAEHKKMSLRAKRSNLFDNGIAAPSERSRNDTDQALFGVVQGSIFEDLRKESAKVIAHMDFDGIAIGGVAVGESKKEMKNVLDWVMPLLPQEKPRHLLGVGEIDDIFVMIEHGIDTFDCVAPTRLARVGILYGKNKQIDITKSLFRNDFHPVEKNCLCYTCTHFTRAYIHHLFHVKELLGYRLATIHNVHFIHRLVDDIRQAIAENQFLELKRKWL